MDALIEHALTKVAACVDAVQKCEKLSQRHTLIARAVHAVDALKSALKTIQ